MKSLFSRFLARGFVWEIVNIFGDCYLIGRSRNQFTSVANSEFQDPERNKNPFLPLFVSFRLFFRLGNSFSSLFFSVLTTTMTNCTDACLPSGKGAESEKRSNIFFSPANSQFPRLLPTLFDISYFFPYCRRRISGRSIAAICREICRSSRTYYYFLGNIYISQEIIIVQKTYVVFP